MPHLPLDSQLILVSHSVAVFVDVVISEFFVLVF